MVRVEIRAEQSLNLVTIVPTLACAKAWYGNSVKNMSTTDITFTYGWYAIHFLKFVTAVGMSNSSPLRGLRSWFTFSWSLYLIFVLFASYLSEPIDSTNCYHVLLNLLVAHWFGSCYYRSCSFGLVKIHQSPWVNVCPSDTNPQIEWCPISV